MSAIRGRPAVYNDLRDLLMATAIWLKTLREGPSRKAAAYSLARFLRWRRRRQDDLVAECLNGTNRTLVEHLKAILEYCQGLDGLYSTKLKHYHTIRSFYAANLVSLPQARLPSGDSNGQNQVRAEPTPSEFMEMLRKAIDVASIKARSIMLVALQGGLDDSTLAEVFNFYAYPQLIKHFGAPPERWDTSRCPVKIDLVRPKSSYRYYTFIDVDAVEALKLWLTVGRGKEIRMCPPEGPNLLPKSSPIYVTSGNGRPITPGYVTRIFRDAGKRAGVNIPPAKSEPFKGARIRYPFHSHEVRDVFISMAKRARADMSAVNFFLGHVIDKLGYDKSPWDDPEHYRREYLKIARPYLNPVSGKALQIEEELSKRFEERLARLEKEMSERLSALPSASGSPPAKQGAVS